MRSVPEGTEVGDFMLVTGNHQHFCFARAVTEHNIRSEKAIMVEDGTKQTLYREAIFHGIHQPLWKFRNITQEARAGSLTAEEAVRFRAIYQELINES